MALSVENNFTNYSGTFPTAVAINATGAGTADGTEYVKLMVDNWLFGPQQALLNRAGLTPDEVTESSSASQTIDAIKKGFGIGPGTVMMYHFNNTFTALGYRILPLNGQGILRASYPELDAITYVGDGNNPTAAAYYRADDAAGTSRNIAGIYLILPESRGYTVRGLDTAASVDPQGASRFLGDNQSFTLENITGNFGLRKTDTSISLVPTASDTGAFLRTIGTGTAVSSVVNNVTTFNYDDVLFDASRVAQTSTETRMVNFSVNFGVVY